MAIEIHSQSVNATLAASQQVSVPKENAVKKDLDKSAANADAPKEVLQEVTKKVSNDLNAQAAEIPEKTVKTLELPREMLQDAVNKLQDYVDKYERDLKFSIDDDTGRTVVRLLDNDSNVVKQYPSEDVLSLISNLEQNKGLFDDQA